MSLKHTEQQRLASYNLWGKGRIGAYIDRGGFGQVYELYGLNADGTADALKVVTIEYTEEAEQRGEDKQKYLLNGLRSMLDEIQRMMEFKQLNNFVSIYGYEDYPIRANGELIGYDILIRMEKLTVLTKYMEERRAQNVPATERDILQVGMDVCTGLQEANLLVQKQSHQAEFIHRDIKPENIFVAADGTYKLGDLGIATMNQSTQYSTVGTPSYMAPEMFLERGYHANVDLFALGRTLEKLTDGMELKSGLQQVICKAEELQPEDRYQTAQEMLEDLNRCVYRLEHPEEFADSEIQTDHPRPIRKWNKHTERMTEKRTVQLPGRTMKVAGIPQELREQTRQAGSGKTNVSEETVLRPQNKRKYVAAVLLVLLLAAGGGFGGWMYYQKTGSESALVMAKVSDCMNQEDYTGALEILYDQSEVVKNSQELSDLQEQCEGAYRDSILQAAETEEQNGALADAVKTIQKGLNILKRDEKLLEVQKQYQAAYREDIISRAKTAYEEQDHIAAQAVIEQGLEVLLRDKTLLEYQKLCEQIAPVSLQEMRFADGNLGQDSAYTDGSISDSQGNQYTGYFALTSANAMLGLTSKPGYNTFELDGTYQTFTATYFVQSDTEHAARFLVLADDVIIYDSGEKTEADGAEQISLDISGVSRLTIQAEENHSSLFSHSPSVIVANAVLKQPFELGRI